jgi:hypothetical protein
VSGDQDQRPQLTRADVQRLAREDPTALAEAQRAGQLADILSGSDRCPTCQRLMSER